MVIDIWIGIILLLVFISIMVYSCCASASKLSRLEEKINDLNKAIEEDKNEKNN